MSQVHVSIISGFLGAGKTTLLQWIIEQTTEKLAIIQNELSEGTSSVRDGY
jgi:G3E family GTPase